MNLNSVSRYTVEMWNIQKYAYKVRFSITENTSSSTIMFIKMRLKKSVRKLANFICVSEQQISYGGHKRKFKEQKNSNRWYTVIILREESYSSRKF